MNLNQSISVEVPILAVVFVFTGIVFAALNVLFVSYVSLQELAAAVVKFGPVV